MTLVARHDERGSLTITARQDDRGRLVIEGHDLGERVRSLWGRGEYEWDITVPANAVPALVEVLGGHPDEDVLELLAAAGDRAWRSWLSQHDIEHEFRSRVGD